MPDRHPAVPACLKQSTEPALQYRLRVEVLGKTPNAGQQAGSLDLSRAGSVSAAEGKYYRASEKAKSGRSTVDWGGVNKRQSNPFVSLDALSVLKRAGRLTQ